MVSQLHEGLLSLVRDQPAFIADVLKLMKIEVPRFAEARLAEAALNELVPVEYNADAVVLFADRKPVFGVIVEAQLQRDKRKPYTWPVYVVTARARHECQVVLVVVAPKASIAKWAAKPIEIGGGMIHRPVVIGPKGIPRITDPARAVREPRLAVLSAVAHGRGDPAIAATIAAAASVAVGRLPEEHWVLYSGLIDSALSRAARKEFEMLPQGQKFFSESQRRFLAEGKAEATTETLADVLLMMLRQRQLVVTEDQQRLITKCTDAATLRHWVERVLSVASVDELLHESRVTARRAPRNGRTARRSSPR
jgi:hypothetical protein